MSRQFEPTLHMDTPKEKSLFEFAKRFLPLIYLAELASKIEANGLAKYADGSGDRHYQNWRVTIDDVFQWIGAWLYMLAFHQPGGREQYFDDTPKEGVGPTYDLKKWLHIGHPGGRGIAWFNQMQACFDLPTYGKPDDKFDKVRYFWYSLRDGFLAAVTPGWIMCLDESMVKWLGRNMPGFMHVQRKPTPKGLELHTLCCALCGILVWFEVYEGKEAMEKKEHCAEQKVLLGASGPWRSIALTLRMIPSILRNSGRVLIADSWFGRASWPCTRWASLPS